MGILGGVDNLQWLFTATFFLMLVMVPVFGVVSARYPRRILLPGIYLFFILNLLLFYLLFALTVTASVQLVGVYLVFASLIIPALTVRKAGNNGLWIAYGLGATGYALGLISSALFDMPAGAVIVLTLVLLSISLTMVTYAAKRG